MIEESEEKKETKHRIALLVELILFPRIRAFNESNDINKEENKKQAIKFFIKEYA